jgi:hypothetical protein
MPSVPMRPFCHSALICLAASSAVLTAVQPSHALLVYTSAGSSISGSLGGTAFVDASWSMTATADETLATLSTFTAPGVGTFNLWWLPVSPRVTIQTMASMLEADLLPASPYRWLALSGTFPVGPTPKIGFVYTTPFFNPETAAGVFDVPGSFVNLQFPISVAGSSIFETHSFPSTAGPLVISSSAVVPGVFRIDPVPGPLPALALAGAFSWSRCLRGRLARRSG